MRGGSLLYFKNLIYFLYPKRCIWCNKKIDENSTYACEKCLNIIKYITDEEVYSVIPEMYFDKLISLFLYKGVVREKILKFKFRDKPYYGRAFAEMMAETVKDKNLDIDFIIPVPMHYKRFFQRGYNQSSILAKGISRNIGIKCRGNILRKIKKSAVQSTLNLKQRRINILNTYGIKNNRKILNKNILLVDDVYTTGATVNECSKVLKENGARRVYVVTIAHGLSVRM